ncbi:MAG TPA: hypothetical protein VG603_14280 [Chitinophagales bacterium]|nr:hypothetical protein [Chitinophagales bacterium]
MKKLKWIAPLFVLAVTLAGCPYSATVPLDAPSVKINDNLLGTWEPKSSNGETYVVTKTDNFTYKIVKNSTDEKTPPVTYSAYMSSVGGDLFLNLKEENGEPKASYYFFKYEISASGAKVTLHPVTDNIKETFTTSADLKAFFTKYKSLSFFYEKDDDVFIKD